jgi:hypothetical protein
MITSSVQDDMHPSRLRKAGPDATTIAFQKLGAKVFVGSRSFGRNMSSLLDDLKVNRVGEDILIIWKIVLVDALVNQLTIQRNPVPLLIFQNSNDAEVAPSEVS